jgi:hypothetical protein
MVLRMPLERGNPLFHCCAMQIEHDPDEKPRKKDELWWLNPLAAAVVGLLWIWFFVYENPHWVSVGIGAFTGMMYAFWACETYGGKPYLSKKRPSETRRDL